MYVFFSIVMTESRYACSDHHAKMRIYYFFVYFYFFAAAAAVAATSLFFLRLLSILSLRSPFD